MSILGNIDTQTFLADYWQQKPLLIRGASSKYGDILTPDELAGLACEQEIESSLIVQEEKDLWSLEHGPLEESRFSDLPEKTGHCWFSRWITGFLKSGMFLMNLVSCLAGDWMM